MRFLKRVNDRGTITLPAEVREVLGVEEGDIVEFEVVGIARKATGKALNPAVGSTESTTFRARIGPDAETGHGGSHA